MYLPLWKQNYAKVLRSKAVIGGPPFPGPCSCWKSRLQVRGQRLCLLGLSHDPKSSPQAWPAPLQLNFINCNTHRFASFPSQLKKTLWIGQDHLPGGRVPFCLCVRKCRADGARTPGCWASAWCCHPLALFSCDHHWTFAKCTWDNVFIRQYANISVGWGVDRAVNWHFLWTKKMHSCLSSYHLQAEKWGIPTWRNHRRTRATFLHPERSSKCSIGQLGSLAYTYTMILPFDIFIFALNSLQSHSVLKEMFKIEIIVKVWAFLKQNVDLGYPSSHRQEDSWGCTKLFFKRGWDVGVLREKRPVEHLLAPSMKGE